MAGRWIKLAVWNKLSTWRMGLGKSSVRAARLVDFMRHKAEFICAKSMCGLAIGLFVAATERRSSVRVSKIAETCVLGEFLHYSCMVLF